MVTVEIAENGYVVRGRTGSGRTLIAIAKHYEEVSHYMSHFLYAESEFDLETPHKVPTYSDKSSEPSLAKAKV